MSGLVFILTPLGRARLINPENTGTSGLRISHIGVSASATGVVGGVLQGEIKRLTTFAGQVVADDTIHVTVRDDTSDVYTLRSFALYFEDGALMGWYAQPAVILEKSEQAMLLLSGDIQFQNLNVTALTFGDSNWTNPIATTTVYGVLRLATPEAAIAGASVVDAITPAGLLAALNARFGAGAPSAFVKPLLALASAALIRGALELGNASVRNEGHGNGLDADLLDGQHGAYYREWANLQNKPASFPPSAHGHAWGDLSGVPSTATRWPTFNEVTDKPATYPPSAHSHAAADVTTGIFDVARIPDLAQSKITGLAAALAARVSKAGDTMYGGLTIDRGVNGPDANREFAVQNGAHYMSVHARMGAGNYNPIVQAGDKCLIWTNGTAGTGAITIAPWAEAAVGLRMEASGETTLYGNLTMQRGVPTQQMLSSNRAFGYRILANVGDTVDYGLEFGRWTATAWQVKATVHAGGLRVDGQMSVTLASGAQYRATANGTNFFDFGIGATTTNDPDAYLVNRANGGILIYTNNSPRGKFLANGVFEWYSSMRTKGSAAGLEIEGRDNINNTFTAYYQAGSFRLYSTVAAGDVFGVTTGGAVWSTGGYDYGSSRKLKDIDGQCEYGLAVVRAVSTLTGRYKPEFNPDGRRRLFFDAEQLLELMPEAVDAEGVEFNDERVPSLKLDQMLPPAYRAIAELADVIDGLRAEIDALKARG